jgi:hypothetical protein
MNLTTPRARSWNRGGTKVPWNPFLLARLAVLKLLASVFSRSRDDMLHWLLAIFELDFVLTHLETL